MQCSQLNCRGDVFLLNMGKQIKIYDIVKKMLKFYDFEKIIQLI